MENLASPQAKILVVDDDTFNLKILSALLVPHYQVLTATSGMQTLALAQKARPDLILLDVMMPEMDGYAVLAQLQAHTGTREIPVIFVSGLDTTADEERGLAMGAVDYITKPFRASIILARVRTHLELKRARDCLRDQNLYLESEIERRMKESQQIQVQLIQSDKLAAIGQLAAGIVHEINTPIAFVSSNLGSLAGYVQDVFELLDAYGSLESVPTAANLSGIEAMRQQKDIDFIREDAVQLIAESKQGMDRVTKIILDLKNFSRMESADIKSIDLHSGLDSTVNIVWNEIKYHCTLNKQYGEIPHIQCIPSQINQVFLNLLVNAAQAVPEKGDITIRTGRSDQEVFVSVADTGTGISAENLSHLFEPFFTTKPAGKGTGLGLSIAYGIVQKHKGRIEVETQLGKGTTFTVWLPISQQPAANPQAASSEQTA